MHKLIKQVAFKRHNTGINAGKKIDFEWKYFRIHIKVTTGYLTNELISVVDAFGLLGLWVAQISRRYSLKNRLYLTQECTEVTI